MNKQEKVIVQQLRDLVANPPPQVRNLKWFWSLQDLMGKFDVEEVPKDPHEGLVKIGETETGEPIWAPEGQMGLKEETLEELDDIEAAKEETEA